ncbi:MAG: glycoside hydrolase family 31 protein [Clostridia bacterium]|nr:glycoside hydrolase family 31 protein [Clostridia bacterium]
MKKSMIRLFSLLLVLVMVLPMMPVYAEDATSSDPTEEGGAAATPGEEGSDGATDSGSEDSSENASAGGSESGSDSSSSSGTTTPPVTGPTPPEIKIPAVKEDVELTPDPFVFDDDLFYVAYKNTTTYSLVRSKKAMNLVKAKVLELQETFMELTAEDSSIAVQILRLCNDSTQYSQQMQEAGHLYKTQYGNRMGATFPIVEDASKLTKNEIYIGQYDWDTKRDLIDRPEISAMAKEYIQSASDFFVHVTEDGDIWVIGGANTTTVVAFDFMVERLMKIDREQRYVAIEKGLTYVYHHEERDNVPFVINNKGETEFEFTLQAYSMEKDVFCRLSYNGSNGWRIQDKQVYSEEYTNLGAAQLLAETLGEKTEFYAEKLTYTENGDQLTITAPDGSYAVVDTKTGVIGFYTKGGTLAQKLLGATHTVYHGTHTVTARFAISKSDVIYGSGGQFKEMNLNGETVTLYTNDIADNTTSVYTVIPFFVNTKGHGVFMNRNEYMTVDIGDTVATEMTFTVTDGSLDCYIFTTESIPDAINEYSKISGYANAPADWSYGMLVCRYDKELDTLDEVYEMVAKMEQYGLAWSGVILEDWDVFSQSKQPQLKTLCETLHAMGKKVIVNVRMGNLPTPYEYTDYLVSYIYQDEKTPANRVPSNPTGEFFDELDKQTLKNSVPYYYIDLTNPEAVKWFFNTYWSELLNDVGVDGAKIDLGGIMADTTGTLTFYDANMATAGAHHWYATSYNNLLWEAIASKPDSGICYINCSGIGAQRTPYMWAGDQTRVKNRLQRQLNYVLTAGLSGIPFVSYDIGGSSYKDGEKMDIKDDAEFFLRALQMTVFMPSMQTSGTVRRPYDFAEEDAEFAYVTELYKLYTKLHEALIPYIQECSQIATETGMPVVRQLVLNYANDTAVYDMQDQYMLGDAFLVAPELSLKTKRDIYLPEGKWLDLNTGEEYVVPAGGQTISGYKANFAQVPVFYNMNTTSENAAAVLGSVQNALDAINAVELP